MISLLKILDGSWEKARGYLRLDLDFIESALNQRWSQTFDDANLLQARTVPGDHESVPRYIANTGDGNTPQWDLVNVSTGVVDRLPFAHLVAATAASVLVGRQSSGPGDFGEITLGGGFTIHGSTLDVNIGNLASQFAFARDGEDGEGSDFPTPIIPNSYLDLSLRLTTPLVIGGNLTDSTLSFRSTSGIGATDAIVLQVGNNGATEAARWKNNGSMVMGAVTSPLPGPHTISAASSTGQTILRLESLTTGAAQGTFISLVANTSGVPESGVQLSNIAGNFSMWSDVVERLILKKTDYFLAWGGLTSSFPALKRSAATFQVRLGDDSAFSDLTGSVLSASRSALGTTSTDGIVLENTTAATGVATVQISPRVRWRGHAWDTAASESVEFIAQVLPASAASPSGAWQLRYSVNGAALANAIVADTSGDLTVSRNMVAAGSLIAGATGLFFWNGRAVLASPADSIVTLSNNATTDFNRLQFGGTSASFPSLKRSGATLQVRLADDSGYADLTTNALSVNGTLTSNGSFVETAAGIMFWNARSVMDSPSDGRWRITNNAQTAGVTLDVSTDVLAKLRNRADTAYATLDVLGLKASGTAGASFGPGAVTSITVVNGIVTAIS